MEIKIKEREIISVWRNNGKKWVKLGKFKTWFYKLFYGQKIMIHESNERRLRIDGRAL